MDRTFKSIRSGMMKELLRGKTKNFYLSIISVFVVSVVILSMTGFTKSSSVSISLINTCSLDSLSGANKVDGLWVTSTTSQLIAQGWVGDPKRNTDSSEIFVEVVDQNNNVVRTILGKSDFKRPDVVKVFGNPAMENTGFNFQLATLTTPGDYFILLGSINSKQHQICVKQYGLRVSQ